MKVAHILNFSPVETYKITRMTSVRMPKKNNINRHFHFAFLIITLLAWLLVMVGILLTGGKHLQDRSIFTRWDVGVHRASLTPPSLIEVSVHI